MAYAMSLQKKQKIRRYLTRNDGQRLDDLAYNRLRAQDISRRFGTSKQMVYNILDDLGYADIRERRYRYLKNQSQYIYQLLKEGIPIDNLLASGDLTCFDIDISKNMKVASLKQLIIRKLFNYHIIEDNDLDARKYVMIASKLQSYIEIIQIGYLFQRNEMYGIHISALFDTSNTRVVNIKNDVHHHGNPLPHLPTSMVRTLCRNICICIDYQNKGISMNTIANTYHLDTSMVERIIECTKPYVKTSYGLELMRTDSFDLQT